MGVDASAGAFRRYGLFFLIALALGFAPGPDILFVFAQSLAHGCLAGVYVTLGLCTGICLHVTLAAFGAGTFLKRHPRAYKTVTLCGAVYLAYLAWGALQGARVVAVDGAAPPPLPPLRLYLRGIVMNVSNPKVILFFLSFLPQFMCPEKGRLVRQFLTLGGVFILATLLVFNVVALSGGAIAGIFAQWPSAPRFLQYFTAVVLFGLSAWIVWTTCRPTPPAGEAKAKS